MKQNMNKGKKKRSHTQRCPEQHSVQSFELQLLHMAAIQYLQNRVCQSGVLYSESEREQTVILQEKGRRMKCEINLSPCVM